MRGTGPFAAPIALRAVTIIPSPDQLAFAVTERTGLKSFQEIRERRYPLRVSMRGQHDHALHPIVNEVLAAAGFSLDDIVSWGGQVRYDEGLPMKSNRFGAMQNGEVDRWESPITDLVPSLKKNRNINCDIADPLGNIGSFRMNHLHPPFNDV